MLDEVKPFLHLYHITGSAVVGVLPLSLQILAENLGVVVAIHACNKVYNLPLDLLMDSE